MFIESKEFVKNLNKWLETADQKYSQFLHVNSSKIPYLFKKQSTLYRGANVDIDFLNKNVGNFSKPTSWSKNKNSSLKFLDEKSYFSGKPKNTSKILITKKITSNDIIIDIDAYVNFYGEDRLIYFGFDELAIDSAKKEAEVIVKPIDIHRNDYIFI